MSSDLITGNNNDFLRARQLLLDPAYDRKFCKYKYISGKKKGTECGRFCRAQGEICGYHARQQRDRVIKLAAKLHPDQPSE